MAGSSGRRVGLVPCPQAGLAWLAMRWGKAGEGGLRQEIVKLGEFLSHSGEAAKQRFGWDGPACRPAEAAGGGVSRTPGNSPPAHGVPFPIPGPGSPLSLLLPAEPGPHGKGQGDRVPGSERGGVRGAEVQDGDEPQGDGSSRGELEVSGVGRSAGLGQVGLWGGQTGPQKQSLGVGRRA